MRRQKRKNEARQPHAPDVLERESSDRGFSAGWGLHQPPTESYIVDCHAHLRVASAGRCRAGIAEFFTRAAALRLRRIVFMDGKAESLQAFARLARRDDRVLWMLWPEHNRPDLKLLQRAARLPGFAGLKLHNNKIMRGEGGRLEDWLSPAWDEVFACCGELGRPVLWHVTQRLSDCPYSGGGRDSYWKEGRAKGVRFNNQDLLDNFLQCVARAPRTTFIGAHHLHIGPESLGRLFQRHANLSADLSCGCTVRLGDGMYPADQKRWREHLLRWQQRLLFGTDCFIAEQVNVWQNWESLSAHIRFVHQLNLTQPALEAVMHGNIERAVRGLAAPKDFPAWGGTRA